jgi:hypothetical protein
MVKRDQKEFIFLWLTMRIKLSFDKIILNILYLQKKKNSKGMTDNQ